MNLLDRDKRKSRFLGAAMAISAVMLLPAKFEAAQNAPATIRVGRSCSCASCGTVSTMSMETYVKGCLGAEWLTSWHSESLKAGAIAIRSYGAWHVYNPKTSTYDICDSTCCQVYNPSKATTASNAAVDATKGVYLVNSSGTIQRAEYSAENNNTGCGNCNTGTCLSDTVCCGTSANGHGRGMCQWGSQRWASGQAKGHAWIVDHYYTQYGWVRKNLLIIPAKPGWYRDSDTSWHLRTTLSGGASEITAVYGSAGSIPVMGDWDGNGSKTVGWFRPSDNSWHLSNTNSSPISAYTCVYGAAGCIPVVGDWDGNGRDSIGWYRDSDRSWHLSNAVSGTIASNYTAIYGATGCKPVTGDWDGNGSDSLGWYRESDGSWHLTNSVSGTAASHYTAVYGTTAVIPVTGDWDANGRAGIGWYRPSDTSWHLTNSVSGAPASNYTFSFGAANAVAVVWQ